LASARALKKTEERQEMENYLKKEREGAKFSFESILNEELRLIGKTPKHPIRGKAVILAGT
jgi:hypothetical protein